MCKASQDSEEAQLTMSWQCEIKTPRGICTEEANIEHGEEHAAAYSHYGTITGIILSEEQFHSVCLPRILSMPTAKFQSYYTFSVILGTVALSYGSVPMYKMVCSVWNWFI